MNDDMFFNKELKQSFFFTKRDATLTHCVSHSINVKKIGFYLDNIDEYRATLFLSARTIDNIYHKKLYKYAPSHGIDSYIKSSWIQCKNHPLIKPLIDKQIYNKFRTNSELQRWIFNLHNIVHKRGILYRERPHKSGRNKILDFIYNTIHWYKTRKSTYVCPCVLGHEKSLKQCATFCINDSGDNTPEMLQANIDYLKKRFPEKSSFEK